MESQSEIQTFEFEGPPGITCAQTDNTLKCKWTPKETIWSLGKTHFCYTAFVWDLKLVNNSFHSSFVYFNFLIFTSEI